MSASEPLHDPADLLDELDAVIREQTLLRLRTMALQARYRALEAHADRYDKPGPSGKTWDAEEFGSVNIRSVVDRLGYAAKEMRWPVEWAAMGREPAEKIREYPQPERGVEAVTATTATEPGGERAQIPGHAFEGLCRDALDAGTERDGVDR